MADHSPPEDVQNSNPEGTHTDGSSPPRFPDKLRVHALAKILGVTSKQLLLKLGELGIEVRGAQSSLGREVAESVHAAYGAPALDVPADAVLAADVPVDAASEVAPTEQSSEGSTAHAAGKAEVSLFTSLPEPIADSSPPTATTYSTPLFLQPETVADPDVAGSDTAGSDTAGSDTAGSDTAGSETAKAPRRRRSRKAAQTSETGTEDQRGTADVSSTDAPADSEPEIAATSSSKTTSSDSDDAEDSTDGSTSEDDTNDSSDDDQSQPRRRRRGRRGRGRGRGEQSSDDSSQNDESDSSDDDSPSGNSNSGQTASAEISNAVVLVDADDTDGDSGGDGDTGSDGDSATDGDQQSSGGRRPRRSRSRNRSADRTDNDSSGDANNASTGEPDQQDTSESDSADQDDDDSDNDGSSRRRRRRRRRKSGADASSDGGATEDDPPNTVVHEREPRNKSRAPKDEVQGITGSTRLEAKRQRRRDGRDAGRRRPPILTESEFLARRESVDRVMVVREKASPDHPLTTQVAVLEDGVLVEHFVTSSATASMVGNVYLGRVQNVLPSMEAAFIDIGRGRNGVLYAGEVNWDAAGLGGNSRKIEQALKPGDQVLVQVSKDPVGHKGARLTTQLSLAGRFLVYVPGGSSTGISRKLPDTERKRLKEILRDIVPPEAGVIIRTAAEGVSEEELARDVTRLQAQWASIEERSANAETGKGVQPQTLYEEPDMLVKVIRDLFNEDFSKLVIEGEKAWTTTANYVETVAPDMVPRLERYDSGSSSVDVFSAHRIDEQLAKALDRKVWLPSGGTLVIDRTEAMTVVDVNTGKFTGSGGNLEETVTRNNIEAAEEVVRQMRLRDIGGMIVVDFIDMVLESNRDLVLRRLTESLGRDRTRHQVSEVTSLGLVQMTRKKLGTGLVEAFSTTCEHCQGRGIVVHPFPIDAKPDDGARNGAQRSSDSSGTPSGSGRRRRGKDKSGDTASPATQETVDAPAVDPSIKRAHPVALAMAAHHDDVVADVSPAEVQDTGSADGRESVVEVVDADQVAAAAATTDALAESGTETDTDAGQAGAASQAVTADAASEAEAGAVAGAVTPSAEPAVEEPAVPTARRGRRVARKAAAPTSEAPDAGAVFVLPVESADSPTTAAAPQPPAATEDGEPAAADVPVTRPKRRRAAARPAGPPVDA